MGVLQAGNTFASHSSSVLRMSPKPVKRWSVANAGVAKNTTVKHFASRETGRLGYGAVLHDVASREEKPVNVPGSSSLATVQALACKAFGWSEAELVSSETGLPLADDAALSAEVDAWAGAEEARRTDTLEAHLESIRSMLVSTSSEVRRTSAQLGAVLRRNSAQFSGATRRNSQPLSPFTRSYISREGTRCGSSRAAPRTTVQCRRPCSSGWPT